MYKKVCAVYGCTLKKNEIRKYHSFPKKKKYRDIWVYKCQRKDMIDTSNSVICAKHFSDKQRTRNLKYELLRCDFPKTYRGLKPDAIPDLELPIQQNKEGKNNLQSKPSVDCTHGDVVYTLEAYQKEGSLFRHQHQTQQDNMKNHTTAAVIYSESNQGKSMETSLCTSTQKRRARSSLQAQTSSHAGQGQVPEGISSLLEGIMDDHNYSCRQHNETNEDIASTSWTPLNLREEPQKMVQESEPNTSNVACLCPYCGECFSRKPAFNTHTVTKHADLLDEQQHQYMKCDLCSQRFPNISGLLLHMTNRHKINLRMNTKEFKSEEGFTRWKSVVQKDCKIEVDKQEDYEVGDDIETWYICRRIGGKRCGFMLCAKSPSGHIKAQCCLDFLGYGKMEIHVLKHQEIIMLPDEDTGADNLCGSVRSSTDSSPRRNAEVMHRQKNPTVSVNGEKESLEVENVNPFPDDAWKSTDAEDMVDPLLPSEDELDLVKDSDLVSLDTRSIFSVSVYDWVRELMDVDLSSVLLYKTQGHKKYGLGKGDFLLGLQTESQADMLRKYGHKCIYTTDSSSTIAPEVKLTTVMVLDEHDQKIPVASLITSKRCPETLGLFFQSLHKRVGEIQTDIFLTDDAELYDCVQMRHFSQPSKILLYRCVSTS